MDVEVVVVADSSLLCLVSLHGVGFEQTPGEQIPGYADYLHRHLSKFLDSSVLSNDPFRLRSEHGENGPIYVHSCWPAYSKQRELGLARLGSWRDIDGRRKIDISGAPLTQGRERISHVALIYADQEEQKTTLSMMFLMMLLSQCRVHRYSSIFGLFGLLRQFIGGVLDQPIGEVRHPAASLSVRKDSARIQEWWQWLPGHLYRRRGTFAIAMQLLSDMAGYLLHNEQREQLRNFVMDALLRLAARDDVEGIILNAHSTGTLIAYDVFRQLPTPARRKIKAIITAGSPLRKYVTLFGWGRKIESEIALPPWYNFWDKRDPMADPLSAPLNWKRGRPIRTSESLFQRINPIKGSTTEVAVIDKEVDNIRNSYGRGLQPHNYWDNQTEFVQALVHILWQSAVVKTLLFSPPASNSGVALYEQTSSM
ncbi:hypothetical protein KTH_14960 [Thermosporothrix hazakensis]|uniref:Alpha/beta hydrolase n=1 Tax=Thermosporothrix sp. COM3 TaxID=2490863 RepID=A0A455SMF6_9CHLR|nr:hypothetical protein KTC_31920 [Thermosporothrix sp. COM3]GCE46627.1 hypothetical protein KTH_14960 [Thermosporothrix hazakensis]